VIEFKNVSKWYGTFRVFTDCTKNNFFDHPEARTERARLFLSRILEH